MKISKPYLFAIVCSFVFKPCALSAPGSVPAVLQKADKIVSMKLRATDSLLYCWVSSRNVLLLATGPAAKLFDLVTHKEIRPSAWTKQQKQEIDCAVRRYCLHEVSDKVDELDDYNRVHMVRPYSAIKLDNFVVRLPKSAYLMDYVSSPTTHQAVLLIATPIVPFVMLGQQLTPVQGNSSAAYSVSLYAYDTQSEQLREIGMLEKLPGSQLNMSHHQLEWQPGSNRISLLFQNTLYAIGVN